MKKANTRLAAILLALVMIFTVMPVAGFADEENTDATEETTAETTEETSEEETETTTEDPAEEVTTAPTEAATDPVEAEALAAAVGIAPTAISYGTLTIEGNNNIPLNTDHDATACADPSHSSHTPPNGWAWDTATATLTLNGYSGGAISIVCGEDDEITLALDGTSTVTSSATYGIDCAGALTISNGGGAVAVPKNSQSRAAPMATAFTAKATLPSAARTLRSRSVGLAFPASGALKSAMRSSQSKTKTAVLFQPTLTSASATVISKLRG